MIRRLFSPRPSSSANSSRARLRRAKQARWRQQRRLSLENLEPRYLLTEIPSLSDAQATYQATMTTLWSQAETAAQTRDTALAAAESQRQTSIGPEQANFDADEDLAWAAYLTDVGTANTAYDASVDPAWATYDSARTTANSDYDADRTTADGVFQIAEWLANIDYDQDVEDLDDFLEETKAAARTQYQTDANLAQTPFDAAVALFPC